MTLHEWAEIGQIVAPIIVLILALLGGLFGYVRFSAKCNELEKHYQGMHDLMFGGPGGTLAFLTEPAHDRLQKACKTSLEDKITTISKTISLMQETMVSANACRQEAREDNAAQIAALRAEILSWHKDTSVAMKGISEKLSTAITENKINTVEIAHLKKEVASLERRKQD